MRIFEVLSGQPTGGIGKSAIWLRNLYDPLVDLGHDVVLFSADGGFAARAGQDSARRRAFSHDLVDSFESEHHKKPFDLVFMYLMDGTVDVDAVDYIRRHAVPTCNFSCNNTHQFDLAASLAPHFDYNLHSEKDASDKFRAIGAVPIWFPMAANPSYYYPREVRRTIDVAFVGQRYARRPQHIAHLLEGGIDVHAYGPGWRLKSDGKGRELLRTARRTQRALRALLAIDPKSRASTSADLAWWDGADAIRRRYEENMHGPLGDEEMVAMFSQAKISLGFLEVFAGHNPAAQVLRHLHLRDFEAPMSGALYLTGYCAELEEFYEVDKEVLVYRSESEMLEKARFYLSHDAEAERVRAAGRTRALRCHTYQRRFTDLFATMGVGR